MQSTPLEVEVHVSIVDARGNIVSYNFDAQFQKTAMSQILITIAEATSLHSIRFHCTSHAPYLSSLVVIEICDSGITM